MSFCKFKLRKLLIMLVVAMALIPRPVFGGSLLFPWRQSSTKWTWTQGWHSGVHKSGSAIDFAPGSKTAVLASRSGSIIQICNGYKSYNLVVKSVDGLILEYWHLKKSERPAGIRLGANVITGQKLGVTSGAHVYDGCGISTGDHVHWVISDLNKVTSLQDWNIGDDGSLSNAEATVGLSHRFKSRNIMNLGEGIGCWEGPNVLLINFQIQFSLPLGLKCYGSRTISFAGETKIDSGAKISFLAGNRLTLSSKFRVSTLGVDNGATQLTFRTGSVSEV